MKITASVTVLLISISSYGQMRGFPSSGSTTPVGMGSMDFRSDRLISGRPLLLTDMGILGNPFLTEEYKRGFVKVRSGQSISNMPVRFDLLNNEIQFLQNGTELALENVDSIAYLEVEGDSNSLRVLKTGYTAIDGRTSSSIYEVLASGNRLHFLKYYQCKIETVKSMGEADKKEFSTQAFLYLYNPATGTIKKVKANKKSITGAFPEYAQQLDKLASDLKTDFHSEKAVSLLIQELNKQVEAKKAF